MSVVQARNEFKGQVKGQKKSPPELQSHTPPTSSFISNVSNRAYRNRLSNEAMDLHHDIGVQSHLVEGDDKQTGRDCPCLEGRSQFF